jgi:hypothetical protein
MVLNRRNTIITSALVGLLLAAFTTLMMVRAADRTEQTIKLSNGQEIYLGQPIADALRAAGTGLRQVNGVRDQYKYVGSDGQSVEAVMIIANNRVEGIRVVANELNVVTSTGVHIGASARIAEAKVGARLQAIPASPTKTNFSGYVLTAGDKSVSYYLIDPCSSDDKVVSIVMAEDGRQATALGRVVPVDCEAGD